MTFACDWGKMNATQKQELAFRLDLSYSYLCTVAKGHRTPSYVIGLCLEKELEKPMIELFPRQQLRRTYKNYDQQNPPNEWDKILHERRLARGGGKINVDVNYRSQNKQ